MEDNLDTKQIREYVDIIVKIKNSNKIKKLKKKSQKEYEEFMDSNFTFFKLNYHTIYKTILIEDNIEYLNMMLNMKDEIDNGGDKNKIEKNMGEILAKEYIYPIINN